MKKLAKISKFSNCIKKTQSRLLVGFHQVAMMDIHETISIMLTNASLCATISVNAQLNLYIHQIDIQTAILNGINIYMEQSKYFKSNTLCMYIF